MSEVTRFAMYAQQKDAPWDEARAGRVLTRALEARSARARRAATARTGLSALAGAAVFVVALRLVSGGAGTGEAATVANESAPSENVPMNRAPSMSGALTMADGALGDGGYEAASQ